MLSREYLLLFNAITDAEQSLYDMAAKLRLVQQQAEELFITADDTSSESETLSLDPSSFYLE